MPPQIDRSGAGSGAAVIKKAQKDSWNIEPMPQETATLSYRQNFSSDEFERMSLGFLPRDMDDKWFIYMENNTLYLHRSWTGFCIYQVKLKADAEMYTVQSALVNRNQTQYKSNDVEYDLEFLHFIINKALLAKDIEFHGVLKEGPSVNMKPWWKFW